MHVGALKNGILLLTKTIKLHIEITGHKWFGFLLHYSNYKCILFSFISYCNQVTWSEISVSSDTIITCFNCSQTLRSSQKFSWLSVITIARTNKVHQPQSASQEINGPV